MTITGIILLSGELFLLGFSVCLALRWMLNEGMPFTARMDIISWIASVNGSVRRLERQIENLKAEIVAFGDNTVSVQSFRRVASNVDGIAEAAGSIKTFKHLAWSLQKRVKKLEEASANETLIEVRNAQSLLNDLQLRVRELEAEMENLSK